MVLEEGRILLARRNPFAKSIFKVRESSKSANCIKKAISSLKKRLFDVIPLG
jgi:hypothetical protein